MMLRDHHVRWIDTFDDIETTANVVRC